MTPAQEYDGESKEEYRAFREEQKRIIKEDRARAKERLKKRRELYAGMRKWRQAMRDPEHSKEVFQNENRIYRIQVDTKKEQPKIDFSNKSILDVLHTAK